MLHSLCRDQYATYCNSSDAGVCLATEIVRVYGVQEEMVSC